MARPPVATAAALLIGSLLVAAGAGAATLYRGSAFGEVAEVEILGLDAVAAEAAVRAAFEELARAEAAAGALVRRSAAAAGGPFTLAPDELALLQRAQGFCLWSEGTLSALGGELYRLWGLRAPVGGRPGPGQIDAALERGRCARLGLDPAGPSARLEGGAELDLFPFEAGWAVDRAIALLTARGVANARVSVGPAVRGLGAGPEGKGWPVYPPAVTAASGPLAPFYLRDRAAALLAAADPPLAVPGERASRYLDLRTGRPPSGRLLTAVVTDLAVDARALAQAMFALGPAPGQLFLGSLSPRPSVLWLVGGGDAEPVLAETNWSAVPKR